MRPLASLVIPFTLCLASVVGDAVGAPAPDAPPAKAADAEKDKPVRNTAEWALDHKKQNPLALEGYDPVAYFPEGGGKALKGKPEFERVHEGVTYRFVSKENLERFEKNPPRYEPAYGGWCAWAMREGDKVEIDPRYFIIQDDRLLLFYKDFFTNTQTKWERGDHAKYIAAADTEWEKISHEKPRIGENAPASDH